MASIEVDILTGIENVETADPQSDSEPEQPRLRATSTTSRNPSTNRRHGERQTEK